MGDRVETIRPSDEAAVTFAQRRLKRPHIDPTDYELDGAVEDLQSAWDLFSSSVHSGVAGQYLNTAVSQVMQCGLTAGKNINY